MARIKAKYIIFSIDAQGVNGRKIPANIGVPSNYTPTEVGTEGTDKMSAHFNGVDVALGDSKQPDVRFTANGGIRTATVIDGFYYCKTAYTFSTLAVILKDEGTSGTTTIVINKNGTQVATTDVAGAGGGKDKSTTAISFSVVEGDDLSMDITSAATAAQGLSVQLY